ncbi:MAG: integrin alpha [Candidatus Midichloria mitochondrii]|nr:integrin alpha [Candidatus Midichloria mitochondrii]MDJ1256069.1 integrin alpha [Candidatus Midichloria mitochondrii]MDJ1287767.1 integrin alpha [Candidatus Midichloria mitochondrii]MDJ1298735.1 integrin alpha [Candidatus Midichloria mitochondrii]MDJ1312617.1 integrin alpha [Candidatus Midichloria mitochondrii]MDJ1583225.1 integrin alpha [Candidatus Midichloria mitochondrii]
MPRAVDGITAGDYAGMSVVASGDMNGDSKSDIIIGAPGA